MENERDLPDAWEWMASFLSNNETTASLVFCKSTELTLLVSASRRANDTMTLSIKAHMDMEKQLTLWVSSPINTSQRKETVIYNAFIGILQAVLNYGSCTEDVALRIDMASVVSSLDSLKHMFNSVLTCLAFCVCVYETTPQVTASCLTTLHHRLRIRSNKVGILQVLGSDVEERLMRSMALAITNMCGGSANVINNVAWSPMPCTYSESSTPGLWKIRVYSPLVALRSYKTHHMELPKDERLRYAVRYLHVEAVIQLAYKVLSSTEVAVKVDNVRCGVVSLTKENILAEEKHFPSKIEVSVGPMQGSHVAMVSVEESSHNPEYEKTREVSVETSLGFESGGSYGITVGATEGITTMMRAWRMEQSVVRGSKGRWSWVLHDPQTSKEVAGSKPNMLEMLQSKAWFKDRYSSAISPFTKQGGIVFSGKAYPASVGWKMLPSWLRDDAGFNMSQRLTWEVSGNIYVTYWPNKHWSSFCETLYLPFCEQVQLQLPRN